MDEINSYFKEIQKHKQTIQGNEQNCSRPENGNKTNKGNTNWENCGYKKLGILIWSTVASFSNRILEQEERILGIKDTVEETDTSVKEAVQSNTLLTQTV